jgi:hypothetical protein
VTFSCLVAGNVKTPPDQPSGKPAASRLTKLFCIGRAEDSALPRAVRRLRLPYMVLTRLRAPLSYVADIDRPLTAILAGAKMYKTYGANLGFTAQKARSGASGEDKLHIVRPTRALYFREKEPY